MVVATLYGRMGNNYFQACAAIGYALKHGLEYHIPDSTLNNSVWPPCIKHLTNDRYNPSLEAVVLREQGHEYQELPFEEGWRNKNIFLHGYFQSELYFKNYRNEILRAFGHIWSINPGICSIHHRYGDYLTLSDKHPVITSGYIQEAMEHILGTTDVHSFCVFSDDIKRAKSVMKKVRMFPSFNISYSEGHSERYDIVRMSACEHNIISNSTFSWWGGWLNTNPEKIVITPDEESWFGNGNAHLSTKDLIPKEWIRIKY